MKRNVLFFMLATVLFYSCATHYVVTDHVERSLNGTRTVLSGDTTSLANTVYGQWQRNPLEQSRVFDFRNERDTMRYAYSQAMTRDGWTVVDDSLMRMLRPQVTVSKSFRWFTTCYRYTAVFPDIDSLPIPISQYLTDEEQQLMFRPLDLPADWNGADMYALLDKLNTKYMKWWSHCLFEKEMEAYAACCDSTQKALLNQYHDTLLTLALADQPNEFKSIGNVATKIPELEFINKINDVGFDALHWAVDHWNLNTRVLWRVVLPDGRMEEHLVSTERLLVGDYSIEETGRTINWWACVLTLLLLAGAVWLILRGAPSEADR